MKANLFKNFKTLKEKEEEKKTADDLKVDNVSVNKAGSAKQLPKKEGFENDMDAPSLMDDSVKKQNPIEKKRPVKREVLEARANLLAKNNNAEYSKQITPNQGKRTFTIFLKPASLEFLKDLVFYKATVERQIFYSQSEGVSEALELLMPTYRDINPRPDFIREQEKNKKGGRKRNSDEVYDSSTTVYIPGQHYDFVKDVTYNKVVSGDLYYKDWDLLESAILLMKDKYGDNIKPRPDYIREDEKLRGRKVTI